MKGKKIFEPRRFEPRDIPALNDLYKFVTGRTRTITQYAWQWLKTPFKNDIFVIDHTVNDDRTNIIGHFGVSAIKFWPGRSHAEHAGIAPCLAGKTGNTMVHTDYREKILYLRYEQKFLEEIRSRYFVLFTTSGVRTVRRLRAALGYTEISAYTLAIRPEKLSSTVLFLNNALKKAGIRFLSFPLSFAAGLGLYTYYALKLIDTRAKKERHARHQFTITQITHNNFDGIEFDQFWDEAKYNYGPTLDRNSEFLKWRFLDNPYSKYEFLTFKKGESLSGYIVLEDFNGESVMLVDAVTASNTPTEFNELMNALIAMRSQTGKASIIIAPTFRCDSAFTNQLEYSGFFIPKKSLKWILGFLKYDDPRFLIHVPDCNTASTELKQVKNWYFTEAFGEGRPRKDKMQ